MKYKEGIIIALLIILSLGILIWFVYRKKKTTWNKFWDDVLYGVISREYGMNTPCNNFYGSGCSGKRYTDVLHLDSGTVGIAHFAAGGLCRLYENMDTQKYFGESSSYMCNNYADKNSGASDQQFWVDGMTQFVNSSESKKIQNRIFAEARSGATNAAIANGWKTDREMAIAVGVSNSFGNSGFENIANNRNWEPETIINWYGQQSSHKNKRKIQIDKWFPKDHQKELVD